MGERPSLATTFRFLIDRAGIFTPAFRSDILRLKAT